MLDLIERLEKAEAGSRELDAAIYQALRFQRGHELGLARENIAVWAHLGGGIVESQGARDVVPPWTTSLDAIVGLIGEKLPGWYFGLQENRWPQEPESTTRRWTAYVDDPCGDEIEGTHRDRHIACCKALLRALQNKDNGHDR